MIEVIFWMTKTSVIDLDRLMEKRIRVKCNGGREMTGILKAHDPLPNLVLDDCVEYLRNPDDLTVLTDKTRHFDRIFLKGTSIIAIAPEEGFELIDNPFIEQSS